ncbi:diguanylate cyclase [Halobacillus salinarum]|uniref:Diguanylate cyclase n=1 Tax=Halobacillus salinarum TaxID=2932257 RepID=A0ABY4EVE6_9BACI|nr:diguanylate cyclase [Halobacillus salinarum]UOQ46136.1 diguanylate cyclase [Halobacillus salinarum]
MANYTHNNEKLQQLKGALFDLFMTRSGMTYSSYMTEMADEIASFVDADVSVIYMLDEWKGQYRLITDKEEINEFFTDGFYCEQLSDRKTNDKVFLKQTLAQSYFMPLEIEKKTFGFIGIANKQAKNLNIRLLEQSAFEITKFVNRIDTFYTTLEEKQRYELLYKVTSKFHSSIDMDGVLREIIATLRKIYPEFHYYLLLSHDYTTDHELPVRELTYERQSSGNASTQAYLTGEVQIEDRLHDQQSFLYAPLKGKQGVYGVLQVVAPSYLFFPQKDIDFFILIANTAGKALENAQLYQQSRKLINDLQLINETSEQLNSNMRLNDKIGYMATQIYHSFEADEVGFLIFNDNKPVVLEGSSPFFTSAQSDPLISIVNEMVFQQKDALFVGDLQMKTGKDRFAYQSVMAVPMKDHEQLNGLVIVLHHTPYFFSFESFKLLQSLVRHSTLSFANAMLREELEKTIITDYLTKLHSRNHLDKCLETCLKHDERGSFVLLDIDNFKSINDTYGHQTGDEVIKQVSNAIMRKLTKDELAARWGGEELAVYLPSFTIEEAYRLTDTIRKEISSSTEPPVTVSCGISSWDSAERPNSKSIVQQADKALYQAKGSGKDQIVVADVLDYS